MDKYKNTEMVSFESLINQSDVISLHCPLNKETFHIINDACISQMKDKVFILNTGRGALIDTKALVKGLKSQKIGAVGLDVYEQESDVFFSDHSLEIIQDDLLMRLTTFPNVLITSHQGFFTTEALDKIAEVTLKNLESLEKTVHCENEVVQ